MKEKLAVPSPGLIHCCMWMDACHKQCSLVYADREPEGYFSVLISVTHHCRVNLKSNGLTSDFSYNPYQLEASNKDKINLIESNKVFLNHIMKSSCKENNKDENCSWSRHQTMWLLAFWLTYSLLAKCLRELLLLLALKFIYNKENHLTLF